VEHFWDWEDEIKLMDKKRSIKPKVLEEIVAYINQINYGEVVVIIHDSRIVQIERKEKKRF
jgi:hypothetical protein